MVTKYAHVYALVIHIIKIIPFQPNFILLKYWHTVDFAFNKILDP